MSNTTDQLPLDASPLKMESERPLGYYIENEWFTTWGAQIAIFFGLLKSLSNKEGYCYASDQYLADKMMCSTRSIKDYLNSLEEKKWIYRNTYNTPAGRKRHIVVKMLFRDYWDSFINRPCVPDDVKRKYIEFTFPGSSAHIPRAESCTSRPQVQKTALAYAKAENCTSLLLRNNIVNKKSTTTEENVAVELQKSGIAGELLEIGLQYYQANKDRIDKKNNPMGFLIYAVKKGIAGDELEKAKLHKDAVAVEQNAWVENQNNAKKLYEELKEQQKGFSMHVEEHAIYFQFSEGGLPIGWRDPQFTKLIHLARRKAYDHIHHSRETNSLDESKTKGKQILRYSNEGKRKDEGGDQKLQN